MVIGGGSLLCILLALSVTSVPVSRALAHCSERESLAFPFLRRHYLSPHSEFLKTSFHFNYVASVPVLLGVESVLSLLAVNALV